MKIRQKNILPLRRTKLLRQDAEMTSYNGAQEPKYLAFFFWKNVTLYRLFPRFGACFPKSLDQKLTSVNSSGPVDVERQCGVLKDGVACARSLTCKSHSMGAKRAVPGRSLPYDMLLAAYQKKNQAKQQSMYSVSTPLLLNLSVERIINILLQRLQLMPMHLSRTKMQGLGQLIPTKNSPQ